MGSGTILVLWPYFYPKTPPSWVTFPPLLLLIDMSELIRKIQERIKEASKGRISGKLSFGRR